MASPRAEAAPKARRTGDAGFERTLFQAADKLRSDMDAAEYKHVVLGLVALKSLSDRFAAARAELGGSEAPADHRARGSAWIPAEARWEALCARAREPGLGEAVAAAVVAIERENPALAGALPRIRGLDERRLADLVALIGTIGADDGGSTDLLGRVYEYFLGEFALAEGRKGGQFYTPRGVVRLLVEALAPHQGRVYDPCCGSGGMFVQSEAFVARRGGRRGDVAVFGQESNPTTWRLARMNLALRGIAADLGPEHADVFERDLHPDLRAEFILANPPFNARDWGAERLADDPRWVFGPPPASCANFAWVQHILHHLAPGGRAGVVLANGSLASEKSGEGEIRRKIVEAGLVDGVVALPPQLFYSTQIPACVWFFARDRRRREILFIDARGLGRMVSRSQRELDDDAVALVSGTYRAFRGDAGGYADVAGFCRAVGLDEVRARGHVLAPGRYVGAAEEDAAAATSFADELAALRVRLGELSERGRVLDAQIRELLDALEGPLDLA